MYKLLFISKTSPYNRVGRSGVPYSIFKQLSKYYDVEWIEEEKLKGFGKVLEKAEILFWKFVGLSIHAPVINQLPIRSYLISTKIRKKIKNKQYDGIFSLDYVNFSFLDGKKPIFFRTDAVLSSFIDYYTPGHSWAIKKVGLLFENFALRHLTYMFAASNWVKQSVINGTEKRIKDRVVVIKTGANIDDNNITYNIKTYNLQKTLNMLIIGYDIERKGIDIAFNATTLLNEKYHINAKLFVIGGKPKEDYLKSGYINYVGQLDKNKPDEYLLFYSTLSHSDLFIFPTKAECHGIVNCEAAAYALPIFSYDTGGVSDYVQDGINGRCFPLDSDGSIYANAIYDAINSGEMNKYSRESRRLYEDEFNWDAWGHKAITFINKALQM